MRYLFFLALWIGFCAPVDAQLGMTGIGGGGFGSSASLPVPTFVQNANGGNGATSSTTTTVAGSTIVAGHMLIASTYWATGPTISSVKDSAGNNLTLACGSYSQSGEMLSIYYEANTPSGLTGITVTYSTGVVFNSVIWSEIAGAATTSPIDGCIGHGQAAASGTDGVTSTNFTTTIANDLIYGGATSVGTNALSAVGTGFTQAANLGFGTVLDEYKTGATPGTYAATFTPTGTPDTLAWGVGIKP